MTHPAPEARLAELGIELGPPIPPIGSYASVVVQGELAFTSGVVGLRAPDWDLLFPGRFGDDLSPEDAYSSARAAMMSTLANLRGALGSLDRVARPIKVTGFVQTLDSVMGLPRVLDGATELLAELFGPGAAPARSAVGVRALPGGASVELESIFALHPRDSVSAAA
jgi:enamine deaminase RidA (YjgF/YER057c/UK114 family)